MTNPNQVMSGKPSALSVAGSSLAPSGPNDTSAEAQALAHLSQRMSFRVANLTLLVPSDSSREVIPSPRYSRLPNAAPWMRGLTNVRGNVIPVVDLAHAFGLPISEKPAYLLIAGRGEEAMGLLIDVLPRLHVISDEQRLPQLPPLPPLLQEAAIAAYAAGEHSHIEIDLNRLFAALARQVAL